ncbi:hypothetical protein RhiLY_13092 [Ceratobasidium sp. AG-Ba]|nr:hypothetical protein RhiLY_13092 [Ceratobasidium sp. AG-Ba]
MSNLFSGNNSQFKARLDALEGKYSRDMKALSRRLHNAEAEIHELRALNASLTDSVDQYRRRLEDLEISRNGEAPQPNHDFTHLHRRSSAQPSTDSSNPELRAGSSAPRPFAYQPNRSKPRPPSSFNHYRPNNVVTPPEIDEETTSVPSSAIPNLTSSTISSPTRRTLSTDDSNNNTRTSPPTTNSRPSGSRTSRSDEINVISELAANREPRVSEKPVISIDFGADYTSVAYVTQFYGGRVKQILRWPGSYEDIRRIPTCLVYGQDGKPLQWGLEAQKKWSDPGFASCSWFEAMLGSVNMENVRGSRIRPLPPGKNFIDIVVDFLSCLKGHIIQQIKWELGRAVDLDWADVWVIVPTLWDSNTREIMHEAAIKAGLVQRNYSTPGSSYDEIWKSRLKIIDKSEAIAAHCVHSTDIQRLRSSQSFIVLGSLAMLELGEVCMRTRVDCAGDALDARFKNLVTRLLDQYPSHIESRSLSYFQMTFDETVKPVFRGREDDRMLFRFNCFSAEDSNNPKVGLVNGELQLPGALLRTEVFDPVFDQTLRFIESHLTNAGRNVDALLLVGELSCSQYLIKLIQERFGPRIPIIARPPDADTAACRGAARHGLCYNTVVSSYIVPRSYIMRVKLPAEPEDERMRAGYIVEEDDGRRSCNNRIQYLLQKGAILKRGQIVKTNLCKFSKTTQDSIFEVLLYTSDSEQIIRYIDQGETSELRKWTIDLNSLPSFKAKTQAGTRVFEPGYTRNADVDFQTLTEFQLGLQIDSSEVRGALIYDSREVNWVTLDHLNVSV